MSRNARPESLRASDIIRVYPRPKSKGFGRRAIVINREVHSDSVKVFFRGLTGGSSDRRISDNVEGIVFLSRKSLHPVEGVWEGEIEPGSPGRIVSYNNRRYEPPAEGEAKVPTKPKSKSGRGSAKSKSNGGQPRATEAQLDKLAAQVVKMRDSQGKKWEDICETLDIQPSRARQLYNRGGGEPAPRESKPAAKKGAKSGAKGKRRPS